MHWLIWIVAFLLLGLWTLLAWGTAWVLGLDPTWLSRLAERLGDWAFAPTLDLWLPGWEGLVAATLQLTHALLSGLGPIATALVWVTWGLGALAIAGVAGLLSAVVGVARRSRGGPAPAR